MKYQVLFVILLISFPLYAYHPFSTDDPGTVDFRHFELEWGNELVFLENAVDEFSGYLQIKSGLAPRLELDIAPTFTYWRDPDYGATSGFGDAILGFKYRFIGDGDGPFNLGMEGLFNLPSGEAEKGLSFGDTVLPTIFLLGTFGRDKTRMIWNLGANFVPEDVPVYLLGVLLEHSINEQLAIGVEFYGESNLKEENPEESLDTLIGGVYSAKEWFTLSGGLGFGLNSDSPDFLVSFASLFSW